MANVYLIQPAFTTGEISPAVGSRVDLDKYRSALLNAENTIIRPYGGCYRRQGSKYIGETKYSDKDTVLVCFYDSLADAYLLEVGWKYIRVWKDGVYTQTELQTPYEDPKKLQWTQSGDVMFICSGDHPVKELRHGSMGWELVDMEILEPYYDIMTQAENIGKAFGSPGTHTYIIPKDGRYTVTIAGGGGGGGGAADDMQGSKRHANGGSGGNGALQTAEYTYSKGTTVTFVIGGGGSGGTARRQNNQDGVVGDGGGSGGTSVLTDTAGHRLEAVGGGGGEGGKSKADKVGLGGWKGRDGNNGQSYGNGGYGGKGGVYVSDTVSNGDNGGSGYGEIKYLGNNSVWASALTGEDITITAVQETFRQGMAGGHIRLSHAMPNKTVSISFYEETSTKTSEAIYVGNKWKIVTHGTHHSEVKLQKSTNGSDWKDYRTYTSNDDQNYTESGAETEGCWMRVVATMWNDDEASKSKLTVDLSRLPYTHEGTAKIKEVLSGTQIKCYVTKEFGSTEATENFAFSNWNAYYGYPSHSGFFQDRFCLAATAKNPYTIWMSRTGDYTNFSVEKADGNVTDDSAIKLDLIVRNRYQIRHLIPSNDLVILTSGNEWIISGDSAITPAKCTPKAQTMRGSSACLPQHIGNRIIHVQRSGSTVRDLGYQYESDNYNGDELDILATHLVKNHALISSAYCQEPDSNLFFVRNDGVLLCLTIIREQNVFAWSHMVTDGKYKWITSIPHNENDELYAIVERNVNGEKKQYIEYFKRMNDDTDEYVDCYVTGSGNQISLPQLVGKEVYIVGDGVQQENKVVPEDGVLELDETYTRIIAGLPYTTKIEQPGMELSLKEGSLQGRVHKVNTVVLRVENTYGGHIGLNFSKMDELKYDEAYTLYTGDLTQTMPLSGIGANTHNHICIKSDEPYPFKLNAIMKEVSIDGGMARAYNG